LRLGGQRLLELAARGDVELAEHLAQVVLDGAGADEQPRADLRIRQTVAGQLRDLRLLWGQPVARLDGALARRLAGRQQLACRARGERRGADRDEGLVRCAQLGPRLQPAAAPAEPFPVEEPGAGVLGADPRPAETFDRLAVEGVGGIGLADQRARPRLDAEAQSVPLTVVPSSS
jgi:hypothetical protein